MHPYRGLINHWNWPARMGNLGMATAARQLRRLVGPVGNVVGQDVLLVTDKAETVTEDGDFEAWVTSRKAKKI